MVLARGDFRCAPCDIRLRVAGSMNDGGLLGLAAGGLGALIAPLSRADFLAGYWERRFLHLPRARRAAVVPTEVTFGVRDFMQTAARLPPRSIFATSRNPETGGHQVLVASADQIEVLLGKGMTIGLSHVQRVHEWVALLVGKLRAELNYAGHIGSNLFLSPSDSGLATHVDPMGVFTLQLDGRKTWRHGARPAIPHVPAYVEAWALDEFRRDNPWAERLPDPDRDAFETTVLEPGDVLYLPGGTWHEALASGHSLALNISLHAAPLHTLLMGGLQGLLAAHERWRWTPPPLPELPEEGGALPAALRDHFEGCAAQLRALVTAEITGEALAALCYPLAFEPDSGDQEPPGISRPDRFRVASFLEYRGRTDMDTGESVVELTVPGRSATLPIEALLFVSRVAEVGTFAAGEILSSAGMSAAYSWDEICAGLAALEATGMIERDEGGVGK
jgi:ribosomal protein L16 Arg81 hydroxylase